MEFSFPKLVMIGASVVGFIKLSDNQLTSARDTALVNYMTKIAERIPSTSEDKLGEGVITVN